MLKLTGTIRAVATIGGGIDKKTGELRATRPVLQVEGLDNRGLVQLYTLTVPDLLPYQGRVGEEISVPVRAWTSVGQVNLSFEAKP